MKKKAELSGNDFLPLVLKLDDLLAHLRNVREMAARLTVLKDTIPGAAAAPGRRRRARTTRCAAARQARRPPGPPPRARGAHRRVEDLSPTLHALAERLAKDHHKRFRLTMNGLAEVPTVYITTVKDCVIQMLRNSAVHGIEPPRSAAHRRRRTSAW